MSEPDKKDTNKKTCPVCDTKLAATDTHCPVCGIDLNIFDIKEALGEIGEIELPEGSKESIDDLMKLVESAEPKKPDELIEKLKTIGESAVEVGGVEFKCPLCGAKVSESADNCPDCGAVFESGVAEEEKQFKCPVCDSLVSEAATFCEKCGVKFVEEAEIEEEQPKPSKPPKVKAKPKKRKRFSWFGLKK